jgi:hypothetical protein
MHDGPFGFDEQGDSMNSFDAQYENWKVAVDKNLRRQNVSVYATEQNGTTIAKRSRINYSYVIEPHLVIARKSPISTDSLEAPPIDFDNESVKTHALDTGCNVLYFFLYNVSNDPMWKRYTERANLFGLSTKDEYLETCIGAPKTVPQVLGGPDRVIRADIPPSILFEYYISNEPTPRLIEPVMLEEDAKKHAEDFYWLQKEKETYLWNDYFRFGQDCSTGDLWNELYVWNETHGFDQAALRKIVSWLRTFVSNKRAEIIARGGVVPAHRPTKTQLEKVKEVIEEVNREEAEKMAARKNPLNKSDTEPSGANNQSP